MQQKKKSTPLSDQEKEFIFANYSNYVCKDMANKLVELFGGIHSEKQIQVFYKTNNLKSSLSVRKSNLNSFSKYPALSEEEIGFVLNNYKGNSRKTLVNMLYDRYGVEHSEGQIKYLLFKNNLDSGVGKAGLFKKGQEPYSKGKKINEFMTVEQIQNMREKCRIANTGENHYRYKPIGSTYINQRGEVVLKIDERQWRREHDFIWELHNGKIPENSKIIHIDGDLQNNDINNLRLVSNVEQGYYRNLNPTDDADINESLYTVSKLSAAIKNKTKKDKKEKTHGKTKED